MRKKLILSILVFVIILSGCGNTHKAFTKGTQINKSGNFKQEILLYGTKDKVSKIQIIFIETGDSKELDTFEKISKKNIEKYKSIKNIKVNLERKEKSVTTSTIINISSKDKIASLIKAKELPAIFEGKEKITAKEIQSLFPDIKFSDIK